jgi:hypothetical protein
MPRVRGWMTPPTTPRRFGQIVDIELHRSGFAFQSCVQINSDTGSPIENFTWSDTHKRTQSAAHIAHRTGAWGREMPYGKLIISRTVCRIAAGASEGSRRIFMSALTAMIRNDSVSGWRGRSKNEWSMHEPERQQEAE